MTGYDLFAVVYAAAVATAFVLFEQWLETRPDLTGDDGPDHWNE